MRYATWKKCEVCGQSVRWAKGRLLLNEDGLSENRDVRIDQEHLSHPDNQDQDRLTPEELSALVNN